MIVLIKFGSASLVHFPWCTLQLLILLGFLAWLVPGVAALDNAPFPEISFHDFSKLVTDCFHPSVPLSVVLAFFFSVLRNPDLLSLHYRQKVSRSQFDSPRDFSPWGAYMATEMIEAWDKESHDQYKSTLLAGMFTSSGKTTKVRAMLSAIERLVGLMRFRTDNASQIPTTDEKSIQHLLFLTPNRVSCRSSACKSVALKRFSRNRDVPRITVIAGTQLHLRAQLLSAHCTICHAIYYPDHSSHLAVQPQTLADQPDTEDGDISETAIAPGQRHRYYVSSANHLKVGQSLWVDRRFASTVLNGLQSFASIASFTDFWSRSFWPDGDLTRRHVWQAFVQTSVREISETYGHPFLTPDGLNIDGVVEHANLQLQRDGAVPGTQSHQCAECVQPYRQPTRVSGDSAATHGVEGSTTNAPPLAENVPTDAPSGSAQLVINGATVRMRVIDGIVMGPLHCAMEDCCEQLLDASKGVWCKEHYRQRGHLCHWKGCSRPLQEGTRACVNHQTQWKKHLERFSRQSLLGMRRRIRQSEQETQTWNPTQRTRPDAPAHDEDGEPVLSPKLHYFLPGRFYCVELMTNPCGVPVAFALFDRSESPTKIIDFIELHHPTPQSKSAYYCVDKACMVLRRLVTLRKWEEWKKTSRLVVDSYHYVNHRVTDFLCRKWCNPAPMDGSAPNLVIPERQPNGSVEYRRAFNTQVCFSLAAVSEGDLTIV